ncbi:hypothetical protein LTS12_002355 [Elasticomyces elasticus]|nr:hypothetical protein LTS12_002355 [Elasticomyces elasticus]
MWLTIPELRHVVLVTCGLLLSKHAAAQSACIAEFGQETVYEQAISINTYVQTNTTFYPAPHYAVTVSNAPTSFDGITTFRYTESRTLGNTAATTRSTASLVATPTVAMNAYVLMVHRDPGRQTDRRKIHQRQSGTFYVAANGTISNDCTMSPIYAVNNGVLTTTVQGTVYTYSTSPGIGFEMFAPSTIPGSITTSFTLGAGGVLVWTNAGFYNGQAAFCSLSNGTIYAVFQQNAQPDGCLYIQLTLFTVSSCQGLSYSTVTGPPGPTGSTGPQGPAGAVGSTGPSGQSGQIGAVGATGSTGPQGQQGPQGISGAVGATQGVSGATGPQGVQGVQGSQGNAGATGPTGLQGIAGSTGPIGATGATGPTGQNGAAGATGASGAVGAVGPTGPHAEEFKVYPEVLGQQAKVDRLAPLESAAKSERPELLAHSKIGHRVTTLRSPLTSGRGATGSPGLQGISGAVGQTGVGPDRLCGIVKQWLMVSRLCVSPLEYVILSVKRHLHELTQVKPTGLSGAVGATGISGAVGQPGPTGAQGPTGIQGAVGPTGPQGIQGIPGQSGAVGATGSTGPSGPTGAQGIPGASATSFNYGYLGCYVQTGSKTSSTGLALPSFQATYSTLVDSSCSQVCASKSFIFFGTVNTGTATADCWCGNNLAYVTSNAGILGAGVVSGEVGENNCYPCIGGAALGSVVGECGNSTLMTMAVFARNF